MSETPPPKMYRIILTGSKDYSVWSTDYDLPRGYTEIEGETLTADKKEADVRMEGFWKKRRLFSTGREYACYNDNCNCTNFRPGYCCEGCHAQADVREDPARPTVDPECHCRHSTCHQQAAESDPQEALDKMAAAVDSPEPPPIPPLPPLSASASVWDKLKRSWAEAGHAIKIEAREAELRKIGAPIPDDWVNAPY